MAKQKRIRIVLFWGMILCLMIIVSACNSEDSNKVSEDNSQAEATATEKVSSIPEFGRDLPLYNFYNLVAINQPKTDVENALGVVPVIDADGFYNYFDPATNWTVYIMYSAGDLVTTKGLVPANGAADLVPLNNTSVNESQVAEITEGMTYTEVQSILEGEGIEIIAMVYPGSKDNIIRNLAWINADYSMLIVSFDNETGTVFNAQFKLAPV